MKGEKLEYLKKNWIKAPLILYLIGFVVHNSYLAKYGNYEFELVQAKYILSGFGAVAFSMFCFAYISIKANLSYIFDSFDVDNLLPWLLRIISLPYIIYSVLYLNSPYELLVNSNPLIKLSAIFFFIANFVFSFTLMDLVFLFSKGGKLGARIIRSIFRVLSIPMIFGTMVIAWNNAEFSSIVKASTYFFFCLIGLGLVQEDRKFGFESDFLDENAKEKHKDMFAIIVGVIAIAFLFGQIVTNYVNAIYPKIPVALGGAKIESVEIYSGSIKSKSLLIQETDKWVLYINEDTGNVEKLKSSKVDKIIYLKLNKASPNN